MNPAAQSARLDPNEQTRPRPSRFAWPVILAGAVLCVACWWARGSGEQAGRRFFLAYLTNFSFVLSLSLGGLFFVLISHVARTGATVAVRRIGEIVAAAVVVPAVLAVGLVVGLLKYDLFAWFHPEKFYHGEHLHLVTHKSAWLNGGFFIARLVFYLLVWSAMGWWYLRTSRRQDRDGQARWTLAMERFSPVGLLLFGLTVTGAAFDWLMSLDASWVSTIFGLYYFAGCVVGFYSLQALLLYVCQGRGLLTCTVNENHYHDVGKMMFAFTVFWAYLAYSQYMLIWYGAIPEETGWLIFRGASTATGHVNLWSAVVLVLLFGHFILPVAGLLSRHVKRRRRWLAAWGAWLLVVHWVDLWWLVMPTLDLGRGNWPANPAAQRLGPYLGVPEIGLLIGMMMMFLGAVAVIGQRGHLLALRDPRLGESLVFENV